jgi:hypothetical protein
MSEIIYDFKAIGGTLRRQGLDDETLAEWHQQRAGECYAILARVIHMPKAEAQALQAAAQFHIEAVRRLLSGSL